MPGAYEKLLTNGEGTILPRAPQSVGVMEGTFQWVRIYRGEDTKKAIGTFYLYYTLDAPDEVEEMWLARVFKGRSPSPVGKHTSSYYFWPRAVELYAAGELSESPGDAEQRSTEILKDEMGSQGVTGLRATTRVSWEERPNHDHVWVLDGYRVRSTKLAPVLHAFRRAGRQRIPVDMIRRAVQAL
ncbi:hypothetical protein HMPREF0290_2200 [Corynebacterium efficiens YS-314]|nr:hypothetical protein HMPREF0290_2200 [Corynebacterium efficiens YS-314]